jgi:hypothetical protein
VSVCVRVQHLLLMCERVCESATFAIDV